MGGGWRRAVLRLDGGAWDGRCVPLDIGRVSIRLTLARLCRRLEASSPQTPSPGLHARERAALMFRSPAGVGSERGVLVGHVVFRSLRGPADASGSSGEQGHPHLDGQALGESQRRQKDQRHEIKMPNDT